jgi:hypothetical protein
VTLSAQHQKADKNAYQLRNERVSLLGQVPPDFSPDEEIWQTRLLAALYLRDYDAAIRVITATPVKWADQALQGQAPESWADGQVARARGDKEKALANVFTS